MANVSLPPSPTRIDLCNYLIATRGYKRYLEIGCAGNESFDGVRCPHKTGVDPASGGTHRMTSDAFFAQLPKDAPPWDLVFIDGLHWCEQVDRDVANALAHLSPNGAIVLHDCDPPTPACAVYPPPTPIVAWNGDVWRSIVRLRFGGGAAAVDVATGDFDWGCGVVLPRRPASSGAEAARRERVAAVLKPDFDHRTLHYDLLRAHRDDLLRLLDPVALETWIETGVESNGEDDDKTAV